MKPMTMMVTSQADEAQLLARALELDEQVLSEIHNRYYLEIYRYAYLRVGEVELAEDIASEVFLRLLNSLPGRRFDRLLKERRGKRGVPKQLRQRLSSRFVAQGFQGNRDGAEM